MGGVLAAAAIGGVAYSVFAGGTVSDTHAGADSCSIDFNTNGTITKTATGGGGTIGKWINPTSLASGSYTIRAHKVSGTTPSGVALDSDLPLSAAKSWGHVLAAPGSASCVLTLTLKLGGNTLATGNVTVSAVAT
jgi:hypothetical protein